MLQSIFQVKYVSRLSDVHISAPVLVECREINLNNLVFFWCISPLGWTIASLQTETGATLQKPDRYNLRFLTETNFIKLKRVKWPQLRDHAVQTNIHLLNCICIKYSFFLEIFLIQLLGNPNWKLFQFIFQTETLFLLLDRVSFCGRGHSITALFLSCTDRPILTHTVSPHPSTDSL